MKKKNLKFSYLALVVTILFSCSTEDNNENNEINLRYDTLYRDFMPFRSFFDTAWMYYGGCQPFRGFCIGPSYPIGSDDVFKNGIAFISTDVLILNFDNETYQQYHRSLENGIVNFDENFILNPELTRDFDINGNIMILAQNAKILRIKDYFQVELHYKITSNY